MSHAPDPNWCGVCGKGLYEERQTGGRQRIGEVFESLSNKAIEQMEGTSEQKREAKRGFGVKIGFCPECLDEYELAPGDLDNLSEIYDQISLRRTETIPERDLTK